MKKKNNSFNRRRILIIDDDVDILDAVSMVLEDEGYEARILPKVTDLMNSIYIISPDLILLDVLMSGKDGREICRELKEHKKFNKIPVVMISADPSTEDGSMKSGANDFLHKPFEVSDLLRIIKKYSDL